MKCAKLALWESHHLACSRACWSVELAHRFREGGVSVPAQDPAPVGVFSTSPLEGIFSSAPLRPENTLPHAPIDKTTDVVEVSVFATSTVLPQVLKISDFEKIEYRVNVVNTDHHAQAAPLTDPDHVKKGRTVFRESRWVSNLDSFSAAEKKPPSDCVSATPPVVEGKLAVPPYLVKGCHRLAVSRTVANSKLDWTSFVSDARVDVRSRKDGNLSQTRIASPFRRC